jgi:excisionase family DNA binding protein
MPSEVVGSGWDSAHLTSGDIARMLHVDLKTIHNWVTQGHIEGARTKGRHLRFARSEVVRFMRKYGYGIPSAVGTPPARVLVLRDTKGTWLPLLRRAASVVEAPDLFAAALMLATEPFEVVVVGLDSELPRVHDFTRAVKAWKPTCSVVLVGLGSKPAARRSFLAVGGSMALPLSNAAELKAIVQFVVGASAAQPSSVEMPVS